MNPLRVAVIGAGHLGRIHARLLGSIDEVTLVGVVDPVVEARERTAAECETASFFSHRELLGQIDAAIVATPTSLHHGVGMELLQAGVHLFIEKPIASTLGEADDLVALAAANDLVLQVGHVERYNPAFTAVQPIVTRPKYIEAVRAGSFTFRSTDIGVVLDLMIHDLDLTLAMVQSEVAEVRALGVSIFGVHEDMAQARLHFENGCVANLSASRASFSAQRTMQIYAERAYAGIDFATRTAKIVRPEERLLRREIDFQALEPAQQAHVKENLFTECLRLETLHVEERNAILDEQREFITCIRNGVAPRVDGTQARRALSVAQLILDEIAHHRWNGQQPGPTGPLLDPLPPLLPVPTFKPLPDPPTHQHRKAG